MRLAARLVLVTAGTLSVAAALAGTLMLRLERAQLTDDAKAEVRTLTRTVQVSVENALRDGQTPDVAELLGRLEVVAGSVDVLVFAPGSASPLLLSAGAADDAGLATIRAEAIAAGPVLREVSGPVGARLVSATVLKDDDGAPLGSLVIARPLSDLAADLRVTAMLTALSAAVFVVVTSLALVVLLRREITAPLSAVVDATSGLGRDLDHPISLPAPASDELRTLRDALIELQAQLLAARDARFEDQARQVALERQLTEADKLVSVGQLAAGLAHEIGSPLQVLVGRAGLLARDASQSDEARRQAGLIEEHAARIAAIVERLQDVVRRRPPHPVSLDLCVPVRKVLSLLETEARRRGVSLDGALTPRVCTVLADDGEVQQIVLNLVLNALQATPRGRAVDVRVGTADGVVSLTVADAGTGMSEGTAARAFEPLFTTRAEQGGTGLGLAVVRSIVDRQRATLHLTSAPGAGTTVRIDWPEVTS